MRILTGKEKKQARCYHIIVNRAERKDKRKQRYINYNIEAGLSLTSLFKNLSQEADKLLNEATCDRVNMICKPTEVIASTRYICLQYLGYRLREIP